MLTREAILAIEDIKVEKVDVPEWGDCVYVKTISGNERDEHDVESRKNVVGTRARLASLCICDDRGNRLFSKEDIGELGKKNGAALDRVLEAIISINKLDSDSVDELAGN